TPTSTWLARASSNDKLTATRLPSGQENPDCASNPYVATRNSPQSFISPSSLLYLRASRLVKRPASVEDGIAGQCRRTDQKRSFIASCTKRPALSVLATCAPEELLTLVPGAAKVG